MSKQLPLPGFDPVPETEEEARERLRAEESAFQRICERFINQEVLCHVGTLVSAVMEADEDMECPFRVIQMPSVPDDRIQALEDMESDFGSYHLESVIDDQPWGNNVFLTENGLDSDKVVEFCSSHPCIAEDPDFADCVEAIWDAVHRENFQPEVYEYWAVSSWLHGLLSREDCQTYQHGYTYIWGRETTGQAIMMDGVIRRIIRTLLDEGCIDRYREGL